MNIVIYIGRIKRLETITNISTHIKHFENSVDSRCDTNT